MLLKSCLTLENIASFHNWQCHQRKTCFLKSLLEVPIFTGFLSCAGGLRSPAHPHKSFLSGAGGLRSPAHPHKPFLSGAGGLRSPAHPHKALGRFTATSVAPTPALPLVVRQGHGPDPRIAAWIGEQLLEVRHLPDHEHPAVSSSEQVLPIPAQLDGLVRHSNVQQGRGSRKACPPQPAPLSNST